MWHRAENELAVVVVPGDAVDSRASRDGLTGSWCSREREVSVEVAELAVVEACFQREHIAAVLGYGQPEMSDVGGPGWNQVDPGRCARGKRIALVNRITVTIDQA